MGSGAQVWVVARPFTLPQDMDFKSSLVVGLENREPTCQVQNTYRFLYPLRQFCKMHFTSPIFQMRKLRSSEGLSDFFRFKPIESKRLLLSWGLKQKRGLSKLQVLSRPRQNTPTNLSKYQTCYLGRVTNHPAVSRTEGI